MARRARDYAAEYARRIDPDRIVRRGPAAGRRVGAIPRQIARGHLTAPPVDELRAPAGRLPRLPRRATPEQREAHAALVDRRRRERHLAALKRQAITGEHRVSGYREITPGFGVPHTWIHRRTAAQVAREIARVGDAAFSFQVVAFGDLLATYAADWRGNLRQWRTIGTGRPEGPVLSLGGARYTDGWTAGEIEYHAFGPDEAGEFGEAGAEQAGPFETVALYELRIVT